MRIAIFHNLPSGGAKRGLFGFTRELASRGHQLTEIRLSTADSAFLPLTPFVSIEQVIQFDPQNCFPWRIPVVGSYLDALTAAHTLYRLDRVSHKVARQVDGDGYDVVFAHDCTIALKPPILKYLTLPTAFYCHHARRGAYYASPVAESVSQQADTTSFAAVRTRLLQLGWKAYWAYFSVLETSSIRAADRCITNSVFSAEARFRDFGVHSNVVYYGIDTESFSPGDCDELNYVLAVGAMTPQKGYRFLVCAPSAAIPESIRPPLLILSNVKNVSEEEALRSLAVRLGVALDVQSALEQATLLQYYRQAKVFVYAPFMEAYGLAPLEAMACAKPVVAVREGGVPESVVNDETGFLVDRDEELFAEAVSRLLTSPGLRAAMGKAGREHVMRTWTWQTSGDRLEAALQEVASAKFRDSERS